MSYLYVSRKIFCIAIPMEETMHIYEHISIVLVIIGREGSGTEAYKFKIKGG